MTQENNFAVCGAGRGSERSRALRLKKMHRAGF